MPGLAYASTERTMNGGRIDSDVEHDDDKFIVVAGHVVRSDFEWNVLPSKFVDECGSVKIFDTCRFRLHSCIPRLQFVVDHLMKSNGMGPLPGRYSRPDYPSSRDQRRILYLVLVTAYRWWMFHSTLYPRMMRDGKFDFHSLERYGCQFSGFFQAFIDLKVPLMGIVGQPFPPDLHCQLDDTYPDGCSERYRVGWLEPHDHYHRIALFGTSEDVVKTGISLLRAVTDTMTCVLDVVNADFYSLKRHREEEVPGKAKACVEGV